MTTYRTFITEIERALRLKRRDGPGVVQYAQLQIRIIPRDAGIVIRIDDSLAETVNPWKKALMRGLQAAISEQEPPVDGFEVVITGIDTHPGDTNEFAVENCARAALLDAFRAGDLIERHYEDE